MKTVAGGSCLADCKILSRDVVTVGWPDPSAVAHPQVVLPYGYCDLYHCFKSTDSEPTEVLGRYCHLLDDQSFARN